ncbi:MAG: hypothetical protein AB2L09_11295 [Coriobacteriia bacterium]
MAAQNDRNDIDRDLDDERLVESKLDREEGVFIENDAHQVTCAEEVGEAACVGDDYPEDPDKTQELSGTVDDLGYTYGVEQPNPVDDDLSVEARAHRSGKPAPDEERETEISKRDEHELWAAQRQLIQEDERTGIHVEGFPEDKVSEIAEAMGDDAAEPLTESPTGTSATGEWSAPEHGGFPEREEE